MRLLVHIVVHTDESPAAKPAARAVVEYRFPDPVVGGLSTRTVIREGLNYTIRQRVIELPPSRYRAKVGARGA